MFNKKIFLILMATLVLISCGPSAEETAATMAVETVQAQQRTEFVEQSIQDTMAAVEAAYTQTPTFTLTFTPEPTFTETPIPSPTVVSMVEVTSETATIWAGPGIAFPSILTAKKGDTFEVYGRSADGSWVVVLVDEARTKGWISISDVKIEGDIDGLLVIESPPTPTVPTAPPSTTVKLTIINQSGGRFIIWVESPGKGRIVATHVTNGTQAVFEIPKGEWIVTLRFRAGDFCDFSFNFTSDILWLVTDTHSCSNNPFQ